ncbi:MAG: PilZ domain-containing protein [Archangium sp.]
MRFLVQHQAAVDDAADVDYASDLSRGGLFINTSKPLTKKSTLHVQFAPRKDARLISVFCQVTDVTPQGVTAQFLDLDEESKDLISASLA